MAGERTTGEGIPDYAGRLEDVRIVTRIVHERDRRGVVGALNRSGSAQERGSGRVVGEIERGGPLMWTWYLVDTDGSILRQGREPTEGDAREALVTGYAAATEELAGEVLAGANGWALQQGHPPTSLGQVRHLLDRLGWREVRGLISVADWAGVIRMAGHCHRIASSGVSSPRDGA